MTEEVLSLTLNADELLQDLDKVEDRANEVEDVVEKVRTTSEQTFSKTMGGVRAVWLATQGIVQAAGGTIDTTFQAIIEGGFGLISIMAPLLAAEAVTPGMQVSAALGFAQMGIAMAAIIAQQQQQQDIAAQFSGLNTTLGAVGMYISNYSL